MIYDKFNPAIKYAIDKIELRNIIFKIDSIVNGTLTMLKLTNDTAARQSFLFPWVVVSEWEWSKCVSASSVFTVLTDQVNQLSIREINQPMDEWMNNDNDLTYYLLFSRLMLIWIILI